MLDEHRSTTGKIVPPPREVNLRNLLLIGSALWLLAALVVGVALLLGRGFSILGRVVTSRWLITCLVGLGVGIAGLLGSRGRGNRP